VGKRTSRRTISPNTLKFGVLSFGLISGQFSSDGSSGPKHALHSLQRRMGHWAGLWIHRAQISKSLRAIARHTTE
jgi:hypothetical protein